MRVDPMNRERRVTCPSCKSTFDFVVTMDAARKNSRLSIILPRGALKCEGESLSKGPASPPPQAVTRTSRKSSGKTIRAQIARCECGASFPLEDTGELTTLQSCPQCQRTYHVVFKIESGTGQKSAIIVPQKAIVRREERIRSMVVSKPPRSATQVAKLAGAGSGMAPAEPPLPGKKSRTRAMTRASRPPSPAKPASPPDIPAGAQAVPCSCGDIFIVRRKDLGREMSCGSCGRRASFEEGRDPQTLAPLIRIRTSSRD